MHKLFSVSLTSFLPSFLSRSLHSTPLHSLPPSLQTPDSKGNLTKRFISLYMHTNNDNKIATYARHQTPELPRFSLLSFRLSQLLVLIVTGKEYGGTVVRGGRLMSGAIYVDMHCRCGCFNVYELAKEER